MSIKEIFLTFLQKATSTRFILSLFAIELSALLLIKGFIGRDEFSKIIIAIVVAYLTGRTASHFAKKIVNGNGEDK